MRYIPTLAIVFLITLVADGVRAGEFDFGDVDFPVFTGQIVRGDAKRLGLRYHGKEDRPSALVVNSSGGDVYEAMAIGRFLRSHESQVILPVGARCLSACVLIMAGAVNRAVLGQVGVHRPYGTGV